MSWHFSAALEAEFLEVTSSDGVPFAQSSGCLTLDPSSCNDKMTESCDHSQSGTMSRPSTGAPGLDAWMLSRVGFRARTSVQRERALESTANAPGCGRTWPESLAKYDPASRSWKTAQCSLLEGLDEFSETWPRWGTMRNGVCWERTTAEPPTVATESGFSELWPTQCLPGNGGSRDSSGRTGLQMAAMKWPTPLSGEGSGGGNARYALAALNGEKRASGATRSLKLRDAALAFPTPTVNDSKNSTLPPSQIGRDNIPGALLRDGQPPGGQLNPDWVEGLMGWPMNWTCVKPMSELDFNSWEMGFMDENEGSCGTTMRMLRSVFAQEAIWGATGRPNSLRETAILLAELCEHAHRPNKARLFLACAEAPENGLRGVRGDSVTPGAPHGPEEGKQLAGKYSDALPVLSQLLARYGEKAWEDGSWENAIPRVTKNVADRVDRLKAIGNGQVPVVAASAFRILSSRLGAVA